MKSGVVLLLVAGAFVLTQGFQGIAFIEDLRARPDGRIIQGSPAVDGQFPHHAFIITTTESGRSTACGGSLIDLKWVLTAAHCVIDGYQVRVNLGNVSHADSIVYLITSNIITHPEYDPSNLNNDVALIGSFVELGPHPTVKPIPIAVDANETFSGLNATVSGFGLTSDDGDSLSPTLNYVGVRVITNTECAAVYGPSVVVSSTICTVGGSSSAQGTCNGDSGGPLILDIDGVTTQIGVVSFGSSAGCSSSAPNGFARVSHFASWINSHIES